MTRPSSAGASRQTIPSGTLAWEAVARGPGVEDRLVAAAFAFLVTPERGLSPEAARALGRHLGMQALPGELASFTEAFAHLGLGRLRLLADAHDRTVFGSSDLRGADVHNPTSCAFALGFAEGATGATRGIATLGAEVHCRARGNPMCTFVVMRKR